MEASGQLQTPAPLPQGKSPWYLLQKSVWAPGLVCIVFIGLYMRIGSIISDSQLYDYAHLCAHGSVIKDLQEFGAGSLISYIRIFYENNLLFFLLLG
jgi:hypothetical protein